MATSDTVVLKRLNGLINVRTDGNNLYAARRVAAGYQFVAYGPLELAPRTPAGGQ